MAITKVSGIGPSTAKILAENGITSAQELAGVTVAELVKVPGFGADRARKAIDSAREVWAAADDSRGQEAKTKTRKSSKAKKAALEEAERQEAKAKKAAKRAAKKAAKKAKKKKAKADLKAAKAKKAARKKAKLKKAKAKKLAKMKASQKTAKSKKAKPGKRKK